MNEKPMNEGEDLRDQCRREHEMSRKRLVLALESVIGKGGMTMKELRAAMLGQNASAKDAREAFMKFWPTKNGELPDTRCMAGVFRRIRNEGEHIKTVSARAGAQRWYVNSH